MATIKFYPHKTKGESKIYIRLKIGKLKDIRQSTLLTIEDAETWNAEKQTPRASTGKNKNLASSLRDLKKQIEDSIDDVEKSKTESLRDINGKWLKGIILNNVNEVPPANLDYLDNYAQHYSDSLKNRFYIKKGVKYRYQQKTIDKYLNITRHFKEYKKHLGTEIEIIDIDEKWANEFLNYLTETKALALNTKGKFITRLKTILRNAEDNDIKVNPKYKNIKSFEDENIVTFLTFEEIETIIEKPMPTKRLQIAKDWFIISCYTAQRISDLFRFTKGSIRNIEGGEYIVFKQYKTKKAIEIPIHYQVKNVLKRYQGNFPPNLSENEQSNRSMLSALIKEVCRTSRIKENVRGRYNGVTAIYPKYKLISNHSGRRSFASNFYSLSGWSNQMIMDITGHDTERSFLKYIDKEDNTLSRKNRAMFDQMEVKDREKKETTLTVVKKAN
jgi:integrase